MITAGHRPAVRPADFPSPRRGPPHRRPITLIVTAVLALRSGIGQPAGVVGAGPVVLPSRHTRGIQHGTDRRVYPWSGRGAPCPTGAVGPQPGRGAPAAIPRLRIGPG